MAICQGNVGAEVEIFDHFLAPDNDLTWGTGTVQVSRFGFVSDDEGSFEWTVDEANGVLAITTDVGDNDSAVLMAGTLIPNVSGPIVTEWRLKVNDVAAGGVAVFVGFTETLSLSAPVMPAEFATATMTYNGTGQILGAQLDADGTVIDWRAVSGDAGAVVGTNRATRAALATAGIRANETMTADEWYIVRVELSSEGVGEVYVGHKNRGLDLILTVTGVPVVNPLYAICMVENRSGNAKVMEVDYGYVKGYCDWEVS